MALEIPPSSTVCVPLFRSTRLRNPRIIFPPSGNNSEMQMKYKLNHEKAINRKIKTCKKDLNIDI